MREETSLTSGQPTHNLQQLFQQELPSETLAVYFQGQCLSPQKASELPVWEKKILILDSVESERQSFNKHTYKLFKSHWSYCCLRKPARILWYSKTMLLPHQVEAAIKVLTSLKPVSHCDTGLGKTIEAG